MLQAIWVVQSRTIDHIANSQIKGDSLIHDWNQWKQIMKMQKKTHGATERQNIVSIIWNRLRCPSRHVEVGRRWRRSRVSLRHQAGCLERYPAATKHLWTIQTKTQAPVRLISSTLILNAERKLFCVRIQRRERFSFDMVVFNRCPRSPWVRMLFSRTRCRTFAMAPCDSLHLPLRTPQTWQLNNIVNNYRTDTYWQDCHVRLRW